MIPWDAYFFSDTDGWLCGGGLVEIVDGEWKRGRKDGDWGSSTLTDIHFFDRDHGWAVGYSFVGGSELYGVIAQYNKVD
jgi:hypothetical protein